MKPFNLEEALAGKPVVTRDGHKVLSIKFHDVPGMSLPISAVIEGNTASFSLQSDGRFSSKIDCDQDLFMVPVKRTIWVNFYPKGLYYTDFRTYQEFSTRAEADEKHEFLGEPPRLGNKAHSFEIEE